MLQILVAAINFLMFLLTLFFIHREDCFFLSNKNLNFMVAENGVVQE